MKNDTPILINGRESKIFYRESKSHKKEKAKIYTLKMVIIIDELLKGNENDFKYLDGITTLNTLTSWDEERLKVKRLSNKILELRKITPKSAILTFRDFNDSEAERKYGIIKDLEVIAFMKKLKQNILTQIGG